MATEPTASDTPTALGPADPLVAQALAAGRDLSRAAVQYHQAVADRFGLNATDMKALDVIQSRGPLSPAALADHLGLGRPAVTTLLDRLQTRELIRRLPDTSDGRRKLVELHPHAMARLGPLYEPFFSRLITVYESLPTRDLQLITKMFTEIANDQFAAAAALRDSGDP